MTGAWLCLALASIAILLNMSDEVFVLAMVGSCICWTINNIRTDTGSNHDRT